MREGPVGSKEKRSCSGKCGKPESGWVTAAGGHQWVVHLADERLCTACHRRPDEEGFTQRRVRTATHVVADLPDIEEGPPASVLRSYHPKFGDCLCHRNNCLIHTLRSGRRRNPEGYV